MIASQTTIRPTFPGPPALSVPALAVVQQQQQQQNSQQSIVDQEQGAEWAIKVEMEDNDFLSECTGASVESMEPRKDLSSEETRKIKRRQYQQ